VKKAPKPPRSLPPLPSGLLPFGLGESHIGALRAWGYRIGLAARDALVAGGDIERSVGDRNARVKAISEHFGLANPHHCLHVEPLGWLRLGETQATRGLQHFLTSNNVRTRLFLKALAPNIAWPPDLQDLNVEAETPAGRGRIDLLISGRSEEKIWGAVIEAKFEHSLEGNPLGDYMRHGMSLTMRLRTELPAERTGALIVLGKRACRQTRKRLSRNRHWRLVHWREVLRRFDGALAEPSLDDDFRRFRRTLWERAGTER
jgi:hypothetical protein